MGDKELMWSLLKDDIERAIEEGKRHGFDLETSKYYGKFEVYKYVLDKMNKLEERIRRGLFNE